MSNSNNGSSSSNGSNVVPLPGAFVSVVKNVRRRLAAFPAGHHEIIHIQRMMTELCDALLLREGDTEIANEIVTEHARLTSAVPSNVQMIPAPMIIDGSSIVQPVVIIPPNAPLPEVIVQKLSNDVFVSEIAPNGSTNGNVAAPNGNIKTSIPVQSVPPIDFASLSAGSQIPATGHVRMVEKGADIAKAMDDEISVVYKGDVIPPGKF